MADLFSHDEIAERYYHFYGLEPDEITVQNIKSEIVIMLNCDYPDNYQILDKAISNNSPEII